MMKVSLLVLTLLFSACSFKTPKNEWQYKSASAFSSYKNNFLSANETLAKNDLTRAVNHAKKSADLSQLATIYLGECSLNIAVGIKDECEKYTDISNLVQNQKLEAYFHLVTQKLQNGSIENLPKSYQNFALHLLQNDYKKANAEILKMEKLSSSLIAASLLKEYVEVSTIDFLIEKTSFYGYKKAVMFWLKESLKYTKDEEVRENIKKKIAILY